MKINYDKITSLSAIVVAVAAVFVAVYEAGVIRDYQEISVWPYLSAYTTDMDGKLPKTNFSFWLKNDGFGPAIIKDMHFTYKGKSYPDMAKLYKEALDLKDKPLMKSDKQAIKVILPGKEAFLFGGQFTSEEKMRAFETLKDNSDFSVCFCSLYKTCWILDNENNVTETKRCKDNK